MEEFIVKVRSYPCLWDTNSVSFRDLGKKVTAWEAVSKECGICSVSQAKALWKRLRDSHREAMRRRKLSQVLTPWKYEELMEFLLPQNTVDAHNDIEEVAVSDEDHKEHETQDSRRHPVYVRVRKRSIENTEERRVDCGKLDVRFNSADRNLERERPGEYKLGVDRNLANQEALKDLFSSLSQKTLLLPKHLQLRVQREVFESVMRAEEEALSYEDPGCSEYERKRRCASSEEPRARIKMEKLDRGDVVIQ